MKRKLRARSKMYIKETYSQSDIEKRQGCFNKQHAATKRPEIKYWKC